MKLSKKGNSSNTNSQAPVYNTGGNSSYRKENPPVDWKTMELDRDSIIPYGKYKGYSLSHIIEYDHKYYDWICSENLYVAWGLVKEKKKKQSDEKKSYQYFIASDGSMWIDIREVEISCSSSKWL